MRSAVLIALAAILAALAGTASLAAEPGMPGPDAEALWKYITQTDPYTKWGQWPGLKGVFHTRSPHGPYVQVFVNKIGLSMTGAPAPYGMIEVKEAYYKSKELRNITVQYKVEKGYNPEDGDWFWVKYSTEGKVDASGKLSGCIRCHRGRSDNDYVLAHFFD